MKVLDNMPNVLFVCAGLMLVVLLSGCSQAVAPAAPTKAAVLATSAPDEHSTPAPTPLVAFHRTGGFAGVDDYLTITPDGKATLTERDRRCEFTLEKSDFDQLVEKLDQADFPNLKDEYLPERPVPDAFTYTITYKGKTVRTMDTAVPEALRPALDNLNRIVQTEGKPQP